MSHFSCPRAAVRRAFPAHFAGLAGLLLLLTLSFPRTGSAQYGGFIAADQASPTSGAGQAGAGALARDASAAYFNPAGMTRLGKSSFLVGLQAIGATLQFQADSATTTSGGGGGDAGGWLPGGSLFYARGFGEKWKLGFSVTAPAGTSVDFDDTWAGRYFIREATLVILDFAPAAAYSLSEKMSVAGRLDVEYSKFRQTLAVNRILPSQPDGEIELDQDAWGVGFGLGANYLPCKGTALGLNYRYKVDQDLSGSISTLSGYSTSSNTSLPLPQGLNLALATDLNERWTLLADAGWTDWSDFDKSVVNVDSLGLSGEIPRNWEDTWHAGVGFHYRHSEKWMFQAGGAYDSSPTTEEDRTPDLPVDRQWRISVGAERRMNTKALSLTYTYLNLGENKLDAQLNPLSGRLVGDFSPSAAHFIGLSWAFN